MDTVKFDLIEDFEEAVKTWAVERNIYAESSPFKQVRKTLEEGLELEDGICKGDREEVKDAIGDILVTLVNVGFYYNLDLLHCAESAYNEIKDRKGKMINGKFEKGEE